MWGWGVPSPPVWLNACKSFIINFVFSWCNMQNKLTVPCSKKCWAAVTVLCQSMLIRLLVNRRFCWLEFHRCHSEEKDCSLQNRITQHSLGKKMSCCGSRRDTRLVSCRLCQILLISSVQKAVTNKYSNWQYIFSPNTPNYFFHPVLVFYSVYLTYFFVSILT